MATFLELVQDTRIECRITGEGPSAVTGQNAEFTRLVRWVREACLDIQREHGGHWRFLRASASCPTAEGVPGYLPSAFGITRFGGWMMQDREGRSVRAYPTAQGPAAENDLAVWDYDDWRDTYFYGGARASRGAPSVVAVGPDDALVLGPIPIAGYTVTADYYKSPQILTAAEDVPEIPAHFHAAIVYKAAMKFAASEAAPEVFDMAERQYGTIFRQLSAQYGPQFRLAGPLV